MLRIVTPQLFVKELTSGTTAPLLCLCSDSNSEAIVQYVVKLKTGGRMTPLSLMLELIASLMGTHLGFVLPEPVLVELDSSSMDVFPMQPQYDRIKENMGINFGSKFIDNLNSVLPNGAIPKNLANDAFRVYLFDTFIQNTDRRKDKPNLLQDGISYYLIDHELGFSFTKLLFGGSQNPWLLDSSIDYFLRNHLFFGRIKPDHQLIDEFCDKLLTLDERFWEFVKSNIPAEWFNESDFEKIKNYSNLIVLHISDYKHQLKTRLIWQ